ncbi:uncharacterized protein LOC125853742 [Solanum stenotomum]|uniref:uncharacterized protein LOC125853742 n=1 Tax=Solanum stenotomum TaxID=172797 RepID=UPI0020D08E0F|nr:uncharacterized protein LOC125853742 [Solanum stenotomum]
MKSFWDELDALNTFSACSCDCVCGAKEKIVKAHQDERLLQFLMGLNDTFIGVRSNILLSFPLPTIGQAYSLVVQDEKQREIHDVPNYPTESASFLVGNSGTRRFDEYKPKPGNFSKKNNLICNYCKKIGHIIEQCYKLHGFPDDFKFTKNKKYQKGHVANNVFSSSEVNSHGVEGSTDQTSLSQENVAQLLQLLQKMNHQTSNTSDGSANITCAGPFIEEPSGGW